MLEKEYIFKKYDNSNYKTYRTSLILDAFKVFV